MSLVGNLPSGTVTMLFCDIEGSTLLLSRLGDRYVDALDGQRSVLRGGQSEVYLGLANWYWVGWVGDREAARRMYEKSIELAHAAGDVARRASALHQFANLELEEGNIDGALELTTEARELARSCGNERDVLLREQDLAWISIYSGHLADAYNRLQRIVPDVRRVREPALNLYVVGTFADLFVRLGDYERAGRLLSASEHLGLAFGWPPENVRDAEWVRLVDLLRDKLGVDAWEKARQTGRAYTALEA